MVLGSGPRDWTRSRAAQRRDPESRYLCRLDFATDVLIGPPGLIEQDGGSSNEGGPMQLEKIAQSALRQDCKAR